MELMVGMQNGMFHGKNIMTGKTVFESSFPATIYAPAPTVTSMIPCDYDNNGKEILLVVSSAGEGKLIVYLSSWASRNSTSNSIYSSPKR